MQTAMELASDALEFWVIVDVRRQEEICNSTGGEPPESGLLVGIIGGGASERLRNCLNITEQ